jgi:hypothetical protein
MSKKHFVNKVDTDFLHDDVNFLRDRMRDLENAIVKLAHFIEKHVCLDNEISKEILKLIIEKIEIYVY